MWEPYGLKRRKANSVAETLCQKLRTESDYDGDDGDDDDDDANGDHDDDDDVTTRRRQ